MPLLVVDHLSKSFSGVAALTDVSFSMEEGEVLGLIGPNGAGKSTLFGVLSGLIPATRGRLLYRGHEISRWSPSRRCRAGLVQTFQLARGFPDLTVEQTIELGRKFGIDRSRRHEPHLSVDEVLEITDLADRRGVLTSALTLAGRKRLEVARALATSPHLLLLDEVMAGLNPAELEIVVAMIRRIHQRGVALLITEHVVESLFQLVPRVLVLHHGELLFSGEIAAASADPAVLEAYLGREEPEEVGPTPAP